MGKLTDPRTSPAPLVHLGVLAARGPGSRQFLQGQLSQQLDAIHAERAMLAGYHSPQGRILAVLRLIPQGPEDVQMLLPRELSSAIASRLAKFVLRAKTRICDESAEWQIYGHWHHGANRHSWADRYVSVERVATGAIGPDAAATAAWQAQDIATGQAQVYLATSEQFVAQMLNLDVLDAIAFDKGCYTGQEIVARAHYRGRVKRRMQRFATNDPTALLRGERLWLADGRSAQVVDTATHETGAQEFLAVTSLTVAETESQPQGDAPANSRRIASSPLPLPYALPA